MAKRKYLINVHTSTGTTAPTRAELKLGEIAVQHTSNDPALWIKMGNSEASNDYAKFISESAITSAISSAWSAITILSATLEDDEIVIAAAFNDVNDKISDVSGNVNTLSSATETHINDSSKHITQADKTKWDNVEKIAVTAVTVNGNGNVLTNASYSNSALTITKGSITSVDSATTANSAATLTGNITSSQVTDLANTIKTTKVNNSVSADTAAKVGKKLSITQSGTTVEYDGSAAVNFAETTLSTASTGNGNVVTSLSVSNHKITYNKELTVASDANLKALSSATQTHIGNNDIHVTAKQKTDWTNSGTSGANAYVGYIAHSANTGIHVTTEQKTAWTNGANSGASAWTAVTALSAATAAHTSNGSIHVTAQQKTDWTNSGKSGASAYTIVTELTGTVNTLSSATHNKITALSAATTAHTSNGDIHVTANQKNTWTTQGGRADTALQSVCGGTYIAATAKAGSNGAWSQTINAVTGSVADGTNGLAIANEVKDYVDSTLSSAVEYKGATSGTPTSAEKGDLYIANSAWTIGSGSSAKKVEVGDFIIYNGSSWDVIQKNLDGAITGSLTAKTVTLGNGVNEIKSLANGTAGTVLASNGTNADPSWTSAVKVYSATTADNASNATKLANSAATTFAHTDGTYPSMTVGNATNAANATNAGNANTVNNLTVETAVPANAVFTDASTTKSGHYTPSSTDSTEGSTTGFIQQIKLDSKKHVVGIVSGTTSYTETSITTAAGTSSSNASAVLVGITPAGTKGHQLNLNTTKKIFSAETADSAAALTGNITTGQVTNLAATIKGTKVDNATSADNAAKVNNHTVNTDVPANALFTDSATTEAGHYTPSTSALTEGSTSGFIKQIKLDSKKHVVAITSGTAITTETQLSKGTATGTGNVVTDLSVNNHQITLTKSFSAAPADQFVTLSGAAHNKITSLSAATTGINSTLTTHTGNSDIHVTAAQKTNWTNSGTSGANAYVGYIAHSANTGIHVTATEKSTWNGKQNAISDLATIRTNAASGMAAYNNVNALSAGTLSELGEKADKATTLAGYGITDAKINNGTITLGTSTITPLTAETAVAVTNNTATDVAAAVVSAIVTGGTKGHSITISKTNKIFSASTADNAAKVNNLTIQTAVPAGALFTDSATTEAGHYTPDTADSTKTKGSTATASFIKQIKLDSKNHVIDIVSANTSFTQTSISVTNGTAVNTASAVVTGITTGGTAGHVLTLGRSNKVFSASTADNLAGSAATDFSKVGHKHAISDVTNLQTTLDGKANTATTLAGYGITDAKINNGVITLGANTITPLTAETFTGITKGTDGTYVTTTVGTLSNKKQTVGVAVTTGSVTSTTAGLAVNTDVKSYVDGLVASNVNYKGATSGVPTTSAKVGDMYIASSQISIAANKSATSAATTAETGDYIIARNSGTSYVWDVIQKNDTGVVTSTDTLTANNLVVGNGTQTIKKLANGTNGNVLTMVSGVPAWSTKPTYTASEVGALPTGTTLDNVADGTTRKLSNYVEKVSGKGLSTNDYTTTEKNKLAGIAAGAEVNVQANWTETSSTSDAYILNKPAIPTETTVAGWGFTKNTGTITGINMNGASKGTSGVVDLGTVLTSHATHKLNVTNGTASSTSGTITFVESMTGNTAATSGDLSLSATRKTVTIPAAANNATITIKMNGSNVGDFTTNQSTAETIDLGTVLTGYTETDPTVPSWAKADTKPTYTAAEVGAVSGVTVAGSNVVNANKVAVIPSASSSVFGVVKTGNFLTNSNGTISVSTGTTSSTVARGDHSHTGYATTAYNKVKVGSSTATAGSSADTLTFSGAGATSLEIDTTNKKITISSTDSKVTAVGNHYTATTATKTGGTTTSNAEWAVKGVTYDAAGHIVGVTSGSVLTAQTSITVTNGTPVNAAAAVVTGITTASTAGHSLTLNRSNKVFSASTADLAADSAKLAGSAASVFAKAEDIPTIDTALNSASTNPVQNKVVTQAIIDNEYVVAQAINDLNTNKLNIADFHDTATTESGHYSPSTTASTVGDASGFIKQIKLDSKKHVIEVTTGSAGDYSALSSATYTHVNNGDIHVTAAQKTSWTNGANSGASAWTAVTALSAATTAHTANTNIHVTAADKTNWDNAATAVGNAVTAVTVSGTGNVLTNASYATSNKTLTLTKGNGVTCESASSSVPVITKIVSITESDYNNLATKDAATLYVVVPDAN